MPEKKQRGQPKKPYKTDIASVRTRVEWKKLVVAEMHKFIEKLKEKENGV